MLYNDFRPKTFSDMIGQAHISEILNNQVKQKSVSHTYLFCGTRGTGKTTSAKILAKAVNCLNPIDGEPCNHCTMCEKIDNGLCTDVIELDAASHNGVDDIRAIIDALKYPAAEAKCRVYIIDEAHMLTNGAVNAFLKTLEEPPENVIFILATTDPQKLPVTILSRCQKFDFRRIKTEDILKRLKHVSQKSGINIDDKSLELIAKVSDGAMRDGLSILDQIKSLDKGSGVKYSEVLGLLGISTNNDLFELTDNIFKSDEIATLGIIDKIDSMGKDFTILVKDYIKFLRNALMTKVMGEKSTSVIAMAGEDIEKLKGLSNVVTSDRIMECIKILQDTEIKMKTTSQIRIALELAVIKMCGIETNFTDKVLNPEVLKPEAKGDGNNIAQPNNDNSLENKITDLKKLKESKKLVIERLKDNKNDKYKKIGIALEKASFILTVSSEIEIKPDNDENRKILQSGSIWVKKGFSQCLEQPEDKIKIIIR